ncbi:MAG: dihydrodipicolinate synthase family protein [bacterium]
MSNYESKKSAPRQFRGMMPIMATAIDSNGALDEGSQRRLVQYCLQCGSVAVGHFGFASEFHKISDRDRRRLIEVIVEEVAGRVPVFIGVTAPGVGIALNYAREAEDLGADLIMAALPYVHIPDTDESFLYYQALSDSVSLPIIVQDIPETSSILTAQLLWRMYKEIGGVQHVKSEGKNFLGKSKELLDLSNGDMSVIGGGGGRHMIHLLRIGVTAFMTGTEALDLHGAAVKAYLQGDEDGAASIYFQKILPYLQFYLDYPDELLKKMLHERGVIDCPDTIAPRAFSPMSEAEWREFNWVLNRIGWRKKWPRIP